MLNTECTLSHSVTQSLSHSFQSVVLMMSMSHFHTAIVMSMRYTQIGVTTDQFRERLSIIFFIRDYSFVQRHKSTPQSPAMML